MKRLCTTCAINCDTEPCMTCLHYEFNKETKGLESKFMQLPPED